MKLLDITSPPKEILRCIVKVSSSTYLTKRGFAFTKKVEVLKRKSQLSIDDITCSINEFPPINFHEVEDGIYELKATNFSHDFETGMIDDWDVVLLPYQELVEQNSPSDSN